MICLTAVIFMRIKIFLISASLLFVVSSGRTYAGDTLPATVGPETPHWSVTWKRLNMSGPVMELAGRLNPLPTKCNAPGLWSIGCETLDRDYADFDKYRPWLCEIGARSARIQSGWAKCEPEAGKYDFGWLDHIVDGLIEEGLTPWMSLGYGNPVYGAEKSLGSRIFSDDRTMKAWRKYVNALVTRYRGKVNEWEIWNEPNLGRGNNSAADYANLVIATVAEIKKVSPDAVIIAGSLSRMPLDFTSDFLDILKKKNVLGDIDYISFHPYFENPDDAVDGILELAELVRSYNPDIKLFMGECGCPCVLEWAHALRYHEWSEYSQAKWVARRMLNDWSLGIRSSIFTFVDLQYPNMMQSFGMLRTNLLKEVVYRRPAFYTFRNIVNVFTPGLVPDRTLEYDCNSARELSLTGVRIGEDIAGAVMWFSDKLPSDALDFQEVDLTLKGVALAEPVLVDLITGRVYNVKRYRGDVMAGRQKFTGLQLWDSPMLLIDMKFLPEGSVSVPVNSDGSVRDMKY